MILLTTSMNKSQVAFKSTNLPTAKLLSNLIHKMAYIKPSIAKSTTHEGFIELDNNPSI